MQFKIIGLACVAVLCACNSESNRPATTVATPSIFESFVNKHVCAVIQFEHVDHGLALQSVCGVLLQADSDGLLIVKEHHHRHSRRREHSASDYRGAICVYVRPSAKHNGHPSGCSRRRIRLLLALSRCQRPEGDSDKRRLSGREATDGRWPESTVQSTGHRS